MRHLFFLWFIVLSDSLFCQPAFTVVSWINFKEEPTSEYYNFDFSQNPYLKKTIHAYKINSNSNFNFSDMDSTLFEYFWDRLSYNGKLVSQLVVKQGDTDYFDLDREGNFGTAFKAFFDEHSLYILIKSIDKKNISKPGSRNFEIMYQSKYADRYEEGYQAALETGIYSSSGTNAQYGRFIELGGLKINLEDSGISSMVASGGQTGHWVAPNKNLLPPEYFWNVKQDNTIQAALALSFTDNLCYLGDEWGPYDIDNVETFDYQEKDTISFDVRFNCILDGSEDETSYFWNSNHPDGYALIYYSGYLIFGGWDDDGISTTTSSFKVYPNPTQNTISILLPEDISPQTCMLKIFNQTGQTIHCSAISNSKTIINLGKLGPKGIYLFQITSKDGSLVNTKKVILN